MTPDYFFVLAMIVFVSRTTLFLKGNLRSKRKSIAQMPKKPFISVIIPARNEEQNISQCLKSIAMNNYPQDRFEIIAVNDRSSDKTPDILKTLTKSIPNLRALDVDPRNNNIKGKPRAIQTAATVAKGDILLFTDADCIVDPQWIETHAMTYNEENIALTASFTNIKAKRIFDKIQAVEWIYMHSMASGGIGLNIPLGCFGNNMSVKKSVFEQLGGYNKIRFSVTEDLALLQSVVDKGKKAKYILSPRSLVTTLPCKSFKEYMSQKKRWAIGGLDLGWKAVFFVASSVAVWTAIVLAVYTSSYYWLAAILLTRIMGDFTIIQLPLTILKISNIRRWTIPAVVFFLIMELLAPFLVIKKEITWKDQVFKREKKAE